MNDYLTIGYWAAGIGCLIIAGALISLSVGEQRIKRNPAWAVAGYFVFLSMAVWFVGFALHGTFNDEELWKILWVVLSLGGALFVVFGVRLLWGRKRMLAAMGTVSSFGIALCAVSWLYELR